MSEVPGYSGKQYLSWQEITNLVSKLLGQLNPSGASFLARPPTTTLPRPTPGLSTPGIPPRARVRGRPDARFGWMISHRETLHPDRRECPEASRKMYLDGFEAYFCEAV